MRAPATRSGGYSKAPTEVSRSASRRFHARACPRRSGSATMQTSRSLSRRAVASRSTPSSTSRTNGATHAPDSAPATISVSAVLSTSWNSRVMRCTRRSRSTSDLAQRDSPVIAITDTLATTRDSHRCNRRGRRTGHATAGSRRPMQRVRTSGLFFAEHGSRFTLRGVSYGPFRRNATGEPFPDKEVCKRDLGLARALGANALRLYDVPPEWLCELANRAGLRLLVGIPWAQHIRFLDSRTARDETRARVRDAACALRSIPNLLGYLVGNEISTQLVRWYGKGRVERWLASLAAEVRSVDPDALVSYANFPTTEYLETDFADFLCFNVYLHGERTLRDYLNRLQNLAHPRPLVLGEFGVDSLREGEERQAQIV